MHIAHTAHVRTRTHTYAHVGTRTHTYAHARTRTHTHAHVRTRTHTFESDRALNLRVASDCEWFVRVVGASGLRVVAPWNASGWCEWSCKWFRLAPWSGSRPNHFCKWSAQVVFASGLACRASGLGISCKWFRHVVQVVFASGCATSVFLERCVQNKCFGDACKWSCEVVQVVGRVIDQICKWSCKWFRSDLQVVLMLGSPSPIACSI